MVNIINGNFEAKESSRILNCKKIVLTTAFLISFVLSQKNEIYNDEKNISDKIDEAVKISLKPKKKSTTHKKSVVAKNMFLNNLSNRGYFMENSEDPTYRSCNFSKVEIDGEEGLLTASHCFCKAPEDTNKDVKFVNESEIDVLNNKFDPDISEKFENLEPLKISQIKNDELIGKTVFIQGYFSINNAILAINIKGKVAIMDSYKDISGVNGDFGFEIEEKSLVKTIKKVRGKSKHPFSSFSGTPVLDEKGEVVSIVTMGAISGKYLIIAKPEAFRMKIKESKLCLKDKKMNGDIN